MEMHHNSLSWRVSAWWLAAFALVATLVVLLPFQANDGDGFLYAFLAENLSQHDWSELFGIKWYGRCQYAATETRYCAYFFEHPPGLFLPPRILAALGFPSAKGIYIADLLFQLGALGCIFLIMKQLVSLRMAKWTVLLVLF